MIPGRLGGKLRRWHLDAPRRRSRRCSASGGAAGFPRVGLPLEPHPAPPLVVARGGTRLCAALCAGTGLFPAVAAVWAAVWGVEVAVATRELDSGKPKTWRLTKSLEEYVARG